MVLSVRSLDHSAIDYQIDALLYTHSVYQAFRHPGIHIFIFGSCRFKPLPTSEARNSGVTASGCRCKLELYGLQKRIDLTINIELFIAFTQHMAANIWTERDRRIRLTI